MYTELLKQLYYQERKKLEAMWISKQESKIRLLKLRKSILERIASRLTIEEISGRADISEKAKETLLDGAANEDKVLERLDKNNSAELDEIGAAEKEELRSATYPAQEYADYLFQLEKVSALEDAISEERLFPEQVYEEQKFINEKGEANDNK